jgi:MFS family permease
MDKPFKLVRKAWLTVALLFVVAALNYLDRMMIATMRESIVTAIPMTDAQFGLLTSVFLWTYGLFSPFAGFIADRFKKTYVIIGSLFVWSAMTWLTGHATTFGGLLVARSLMGISEAFYIPAALSLIVDYHKRGTTLSLATGIHLAGLNVGQSLGFLGGWIAENTSWNEVFNIFGVIGIVYSVFLIFTLKEPDKKHVVVDSDAEKNTQTINFGHALKAIFKEKSFICLLLIWCLLGIVGWVVMGWLPTYYKDHFHLTQRMAGLYATAYLYPASIFGLITGGFLADRWFKTNPSARILVPLIGLCVAAPCVFMAGYTHVLALAIILFLVYAFTKVFVDANLMPVLCMLIDTRYRATGYGVLNMLATIVGGIGIVVAGALRDSNINLGIMYRFAALCMVICIVLFIIIKNYIKLL